MKRVLSLVGLVAVAALIAGCGEAPTGAPSVDYVAIEEGAQLRLTWTEVVDAEGYKIYVDDVEVADITGTSYDVEGPAKEVEVSAYGAGEETAPWSLDTSPEITASLTVYGRADTASDHPSGFGFVTDGTAVAYALSDSSTWPNLDFYLDDADYTVMTLCSPDERDYNDEENASSEAATTDFDEVDVADPPGTYLTSREMAVNAVYSIWVDPNANGWDAENDNFGKIKVLSISGHEVTLKLAYQKVEGLRWVVTP